MSTDAQAVALVNQDLARLLHGEMARLDVIKNLSGPEELDRIFRKKSGILVQGVQGVRSADQYRVEGILDTLSQFWNEHEADYLAALSRMSGMKVVTRSPRLVACQD